MVYPQTEIFDPNSVEWELYNQLPDNWMQSECLVQHGDDIYSFRGDEIMKLDTLDWTVEDLGTLPDFLDISVDGSCNMVRVDGRVGEEKKILLCFSHCISLFADLFERTDTSHFDNRALASISIPL